MFVGTIVFCIELDLSSLEPACESSNYNEYKLLDPSSVSPLCFHCVELTVDAAYSAVAICSRAHFYQAQKVDLRGGKKIQQQNVETVSLHNSRHFSQHIATIMDGLYCALRQPELERTTLQVSSKTDVYCMNMFVKRDVPLGPPGESILL